MGRVKLAASTWALQVSDKCPVSWTLNLTPERIDEARRDPRGFTESLKRDLDRAFKRELGSVPLYLPNAVRITVDSEFYEMHSDSVEFWTPGSPTFPGLEIYRR